MEVVVVAAGVVVVVVAAAFLAGLVVVAALRAALLTLRPRLPLRIPLLRGFDAMMSVREERLVHVEYVAE